MTRFSFLLVALLILAIPVGLASTVVRKVDYVSMQIQAASTDGSSSGTGHSHGDPALYGFSLAIDHGGHGGSKFHHEEDGKSHGFSFEKWDRHRGLRQFGCACLKYVLVLLHLAVILVAFLHQLHG